MNKDIELKINLQVIEDIKSSKRLLEENIKDLIQQFYHAHNVDIDKICILRTNRYDLEIKILTVSL